MRFTVRRLATALALVLLAVPLATEAQPAAKVARVGILWLGAPSRGEVALRQALRELGWVEGQNLVIERRFATRNDLFAELVSELLRLNVDVIVSSVTPAIQAAKKATTTLPIVMVAVADPVASGLVTNLAHPGGNVTGFAFGVGGLNAKRLELLKEAVPKISRVAVLWNPTNRGSRDAWDETQVAARKLGVTVLSFEVRAANDFERVFAAIRRESSHALVVIRDAVTSRNRSRIVEFAAQSRLPAMASVGEFVEDGGLLAYGASQTDLWRRAAAYVDRILKGAKPANLPVEQPTKFDLVINLKTAQALGLTIPPSLLLRADQVIE